jgi:2-amino-4-hydroxy-6-hydroxymethyldihydropteridine diphosphokinase
VRHGRPAGVVEAAIARLDADFALFDASPIILNKAVGGAGRDFANAVALVESPLEPPAMLASLKSIERDFGRRRGRRWGERVLDLDLAAWSGGRFRSRSLQIPHPRIAERLFVVAPLAAIAPAWRLPGPTTPRHLSSRLGKRRPCR